MIEKIKEAEAQPKRVVWLIVSGSLIDKYFREEDYEKAAGHFLSIFKEKFVEEAQAFINHHFGTLRFEREIPRVSPELVTQLEYETEWFPAK